MSLVQASHPLPLILPPSPTQAQMATTEHQLDQFNRCIGKYKEDLYVRQREHGEKSANIRNLKVEIAKLKKAKNDKWLRFGDWIPRAKAEIQVGVLML